MMSEININNRFKRGSEWRAWDLQVHTPFSHLNNGFGTDWDIYVKELFQRAIANDIGVIGVTDYFTIDGYKKIKQEYLENEPKMAALFSTQEIEAIKEILLLPNVEFRLNKLVGSSRLNYHVIFSDKVGIKDIEENFLHDIDFVYEGGPQSASEKRKLKVANLDALGAKLKGEHQPFARYKDLFVGMMNAVVDDEQLKDILHNKRSIFDGKFVIALPCDEDLSQVSWNAQDHQARKVLIQQSDFLFSNNAKTIVWGLGKTYESPDLYIREFKSIKPCVSGSDAHTFEEMYVKNAPKKFWVKADTTFEGLLQIKNEPERCLIDELPGILKRVHDYPTKYIDSLKIFRNTGARTTDIWFDKFEVSFNHELTAIIGNKGKGKSALADIIGLCGNSHNYEYFSFLNDKKFKKPQPINLASEFTGSLVWKDGQTTTRNLNDTPTDTYEKVKYLPQNYLEALCTNIDKKVFEEELEKVIFSRLDDAEKLGKRSLREIINYRKEIIANSINQKKSLLANLNSEIMELERKSAPDYVRTIIENIQQKQAELDAHQAKKPIVKEPPTDSPEQAKKNEDTTKKISALRELIDIANTERINVSEEKSLLVQEIAELSRLQQSFSDLKSIIDRTLEGNKPLIEKFNLAANSIISYSINVESIAKLIGGKQTRVTAIDFLFSTSNEQNFETRISLLQQEIKKLQEELDGPNKEFQQSLTILKDWQGLHDKIVGDSKKEGSLEYFKAIKKYIDEELATELQSKRNARKECALEILAKKHDIIAIYKELYRPVTEFIEQNQNEISEYNVNIDVKLNLINFQDKFFGYVSNGIAGSFVGTTDSRILLNRLIRVVDFNDMNAVISWLENIVDHLHFDKREGLNNLKRDVKKQLKSNYNEDQFYNFLYGLEFIEPGYELRLADKSLAELSPGERGALLLIFYLLLDKDDIPIIIDQPEENLDNQSVYKILVPFIKKAKKRRQIIIVTHNPNLAVVCDADQIIRTDIDKGNKNKFTVKSGSLENTNINAETIDVLEGTRPALNNRTSKYDIFKTQHFS